MSDDPTGRLDATAQAALVRSGEVRVRELVDAAIERAERTHEALNAIVHRQFDRARGDADRVDAALAGDPSARAHAAEAPFAGVPFLLKDYNAAEAGEPLCMGVPALRSMGYRPTVDSAIAQRFRGAGLIPIGRTNVPQLALVGTTEPELDGPTRNPWDTSRMPGGSSGGSAAAVAAGVVAAAHANDISGSIRIPAALCGLVGMKPTRGRIMPGGPADRPVGMCTEGVLTRTVRDTAALLDVLSHTSPWWPAPGGDRSLAAAAEGTRTPDARRPLRIGVWTQAFNGSTVDADCEGAALEAARTLESLGHHVETAAPAVLSSTELWDLAKVLLMSTATADVDAWSAVVGRPLTAEDLEVRTWAAVEAGRAISAAQLLHALERIQVLSAEALGWWERFDLLVTPSTASPAVPLGDYLRAYESGRGSAFTRPFNVTGQPAISLPTHWPADGLPRGVQLIGAYGRDDLVIAAAASLEVALPWHAHRPPIE
jgi:amidase